MFFLPVIVVMVVVLLIFSLMPLLTASAVRKQYRGVIKEFSHDAHSPIGNFEETHVDRVGKQVIHHEDPEPGYVILNGKRRKIEDCKNL